MLGLFGSSKNYSVGIDFGTSAIKVVELLNKDHKMKLVNYGWVDLGLLNPSSVVRPAVPEAQDALNKNLQKSLERLVKSLHLHSKAAYISLPGFSGLITVVEFPDMPKEEIEEAIRFEAKKHIPISLDDVALDWEIIGERKKEKNEILPVSSNGVQPPPKKEPPKTPIWNKSLGSILNKDKAGGAGADTIQEILLVAAPKSEVIRCGNIVKGAGLHVKNVELEVFSLARSMVGSDQGCFLVVDIGARMTNILLIEKGMIRVNRNVEGGGNEITNTIAENLNIAHQRAEDLKKEKKDILNDRAMSLTIPVLDMIISESVRIMNAYKDKHGGNGRIDGILLSGGSSKLQGIDTYFTQKTGIQTAIGNPWRRIEYEEKIHPFVEKMGTSFSVALGLAIRGIEEINVH